MAPRPSNPVGLSPSSDVTLSIDAITQRYIHYREHTPGSLLIAPCDLLGQRVVDVVPTVAEQIDRAAHEAARSGRVVPFQYELRGRVRRARVLRKDQRIIVEVNEIRRCEPTG